MVQPTGTDTARAFDAGESPATDSTMSPVVAQNVPHGTQQDSAVVPDGDADTTQPASQPEDSPSLRSVIATARAAQDPVCDAGTLANTREGNRNGYRQIDEYRCEGLFGASVSGEVLRIVSLTSAFVYDSSTGQPIQISWNAPSNSSVRITAEATKRDLYYRMDAKPPSGSYEWPTDLLRARRISDRDFGILGVMAGGGDHDVFVPLRAVQDANADRGQRYTMQVVPNVRMSEMQVTLAQVDRAGAEPSGAFIKEGELVRQRSFPETRPVSITIAHSDLPGAGFYFVQITGKRANGREVTMSPLWFYHSGGGQTDR